MAEMPRERKVGLAVLASLLCLGALVVFLGRIHFSAPGYPLLVKFSYVDSLKEDAPVLYGGGVKVGTVDKVTVKEGRVQVKLHIFKQMEVPKDSSFTIHTSGILGEKYVQVNAGNLASGVLAPGTEMEGMDPGSLDRTLQRIEALTEFLEPILRDPKLKKGFAGAMGNFERLTAELANLVQDTSGDIRVSVRNLKELSTGLRGKTEEIKDVITNAKGMLNEKNRQNLEKSLVSLEGTLSKLDKALAQIDAKKGPIGTLIYDDETGENLRDILRDLKNHPWKLLWKK